MFLCGYGIIDYMKIFGLEITRANKKTSDKVNVNYEIQEYRAWYSGKSSKLLDFYLTHNATGYNKGDLTTYLQDRNYFWSVSARDLGNDYKKIHSGLPKAIVDTLINVVGDFDVKTSESTSERLNELIERLKDLITIEQLPFTLVDGQGAIKINVSAEKQKIILKYYKADECKVLTDNDDEIVGCEFYDLYTSQSKVYKFIDKRYTDFKNSYVEYSLVDEQGNEVEPSSVELDLPSKNDNLTFEGLNKPLSVWCKIYASDENTILGKSIFQGKIDLFDDLDMTISQASQSVKVSTPVEYYPDDLTKRGKNGEVILPKAFNRQFMKLPTTLPNGDGDTPFSSITTTQPNIVFDKYYTQVEALYNEILIGFLAPATMGLNVARNDNALAQREKEKQTIFTRNTICKAEENIIKSTLLICVKLLNTLFKESISEDISVKFSDYATPTLAEKLSTYGEAYQNGLISTIKFVNLVWSDTISEKEKANELTYIEREKNKDLISTDEFEEDLQE